MDFEGEMDGVEEVEVDGSKTFRELDGELVGRFEVGIAAIEEVVEGYTDEATNGPEDDRGELPGGFRVAVLAAGIELLPPDEDDTGGTLTDVVVVLLGAAESPDEAELLACKVVLVVKGKMEDGCKDPSACEELGGFTGERERVSIIELASTEIEDGILVPAVDGAATLAVLEEPNIRPEWLASIAL